MSPRDLVYFIQGFLEMTPAGQGMTIEQVDTLRRHVALVLTNVTDDATIGSNVISRLTEEESAVEVEYTSTDASQNPEMTKSWNYIPASRMCLTC